MNIRRAVFNDIDDIVGLCRFLGVWYLLIFNKREAVRLAITHPGTEVYVAEDGGKVIGTATVSFRGVPSHGLVAFIDDVVVCPSCRRKGIGTALSKHCIQVAKERNACRVELASNPSRKEANDIYEKLGLKKQDTNFRRKLLKLF